MSNALDVQANPVLRWLQKTLTDLSPFAAYQYLDVVFPATPDTDKDLVHTLRPINPEAIDYLVVRADRACAVYNDNLSTRRPWGQGYITLRCSVASAQVRVLLVRRKESS